MQSSLDRQRLTCLADGAVDHGIDLGLGEQFHIAVRANAKTGGLSPAASDFLLPVIRYLPLVIVIFSLRRFRRPRALHQRGGLACSIHPMPHKFRRRIISSISPRERISQIAAILPGIDKQRSRNAAKMIIAPRSTSDARTSSPREYMFLIRAAFGLLARQLGAGGSEAGSVAIAMPPVGLGSMRRERIRHRGKAVERPLRRTGIGRNVAQGAGHAGPVALKHLDCIC